MKSPLKSVLLILPLLASAVFILTAAEPGSSTLQVGRTISKWGLQDFRGKSWSLDELQGKKATVIAFLGVECPIAAQYATRLKQLSNHYCDSGVSFAAIDSNQQDSLAELAHFARTHELEFPLLKDPGNKIADQFAAQRTPEVFLLDANRKVVFHGRIDDQFTYGIQRSKVEHHYLADAIDQLLAGENVAVAHADPVGCLIGRVLVGRAAPAGETVTYSKHIARILQDNCVRCHRPGASPVANDSGGRHCGTRRRHDQRSWRYVRGRRCRR